MPLTDMTAGVLDAHEPQRVNNIALRFAELDGADILELAVESFPLPKRSIGIIEAGHLNEKRKFAGNPIYEDMSIVFKDLVTANVAGIIESWWKLVHDSETGRTGFATAYKKSGYAILYAPDGSLERKWKITGAWPSAFDPGDADMTGEDFIRINLTLTLDKVVADAGIIAA